MAKSKIVMLPGTGGEWNVNGKPWGEVRKTTPGTRKPTSKESGVIKRQTKGSTKSHKAGNKRAGIN